MTTTLPFTIDDLQGGSQTRFRFDGREVLYECRGGEETFPQTDEGRVALREHDFEHHERIMHYDWTELNGQEVTIFAVQRVGEPTFLDPSGLLQTELIARAKDGTIYFLPFSYYDEGDKGDFKWKPKQDGLTRLREISSGPMPNDPALLLFGSGDMGESSDRATATGKAARVGNP